MLLARDVGGARLPLGVERVEVLVEPLLARLAGVDGAMKSALAALIGHGGVCRPAGFNPKNTRPFHLVPVIACAMADSERYRVPFQM